MRDKWKIPGMILLICATLVMWRCASPGTAPVPVAPIPVLTNQPSPPESGASALPPSTNQPKTNALIQPSAPALPPAVSPVEAGLELIIADVLARNPDALPRLSAISRGLHDRLKNGEGAPDRLFERYWEVFRKIGRLAAEGEPAAFDALVAAAEDPLLQGVAVMGLGEAAGHGHEQALEMLLNPKEHGLLESGTISALKPAADAGNQRAIANLAEHAYRTNNSGLWYMIVSGLENPAAQGDRVAIEAVREIARREGSQGVTEARRILGRAGEPMPAQ